MKELNDELVILFQKYKLGRICKIIKTEMKWAKGDIYLVTTWLKKYIVYEEDGHVKSIKDDEKYYYQRSA